MKKGTKKALLIIGTIGVAAVIIYVLSKQNSAASFGGVHSLSANVMITVTPYTEGNGKITSITVTDNVKGNVYTWTNGSWSPSAPSCYVGTGALTVAFTVANQGNASASFTLKLDTYTGVILQTVTATLAVGGTTTLSYTGDMPSTRYDLGAHVTP